MRLVTIDNGNTNPSVGFFNSNSLVSIVPLKDYSPNKDDYILMASVGKKISLTPHFNLKSKRESHFFFDMPIHYSLSLGEDRLVAAYFLYKNLKKNESLLLIDAGTFTTYDFITEKGFQGGYIFPGIDLFLKTYTAGANLPLLKKSQLVNNKQNKKIPGHTEEAILDATNIYLHSINAEVIGKTMPTKIILTGGNAFFLEKLLNLKHPFEIHPHLIHLALALIYETHLRPK